MSEAPLPWAGFVTFCGVADLARTARFYEEQLGLPLALDQGSCRIYRVTETAYLGFCAKPEAPRPDGVILTLLTDDVEARCAALEARGVRFEKAPQHNPRYDITHAFLRDPDGYLVEIQRFDDPRWPGPAGAR
ncbi:MAG TPA: VOC family protein [Polyangiaceae bacterium LLY-WYZ-15_(1-7)]|nr:glyoxalase [Sandaracinus sp.]HJL03870.1 VOC family protein [Polyangiaceae bacterium LLY-WYZ-15_(1-7)]MBJ73303.1 glyoxalase [Sandaracinus sp.]HJL07606.1 VOC family protein [Polyangiaceae bacterium LLY-WYZ-15_(1-7)]HJL24164.1 VOC family protein [Polyangiaceae bacterium LLY-WYZ-15_(1-7)]